MQYLAHMPQKHIEVGLRMYVSLYDSLSTHIITDKKFIAAAQIQDLDLTPLVRVISGVEFVPGIFISSKISHSIQFGVSCATFLLHWQYTVRSLGRIYCLCPKDKLNVSHVLNPTSLTISPRSWVTSLYRPLESSSVVDPLPNQCPCR